MVMRGLQGVQLTLLGPQLVGREEPILDVGPGTVDRDEGAFRRPGLPNKVSRGYMFGPQPDHLAERFEWTIRLCLDGRRALHLRKGRRRTERDEEDNQECRRAVIHMLAHFQKSRSSPSSGPRQADRPPYPAPPRRYRDASAKPDILKMIRSASLESYRKIPAHG